MTGAVFEMKRSGHVTQTGDQVTVAMRYVLDSQSDETSACLTDIRATLTANGHRAKDSHDWELVLAEVLNNVIEHACDGTPGHVINLTVAFSEQQMRAEVTDDGRPMPNDQLPEGREQSLCVDPADLPEGGFGWFLIRTLCSSLNYSSKNGQNCLAVVVPISF